MDETNYTTEHRKGQHLNSEERHEIEVRLKDNRSIYRIAKHLNRPYNTVKNEIARGTISLYNGHVKRYKADVGEKVYLKNRTESRRKYRCLAVSAFLQYVKQHFYADKWSLDACVGKVERSFAHEIGTLRPETATALLFRSSLRSSLKSKAISTVNSLLTIATCYCNLRRFLL